MKKLRLMIATLSLCILSTYTFAETPISNAVVKEIKVQFKKNTSSRAYKGSVTGYNYHQYSFFAKKGQVLKIDLSSNTGNADAYLFNKNLPDSVNLDMNKDGYILPDPGEYQIRVLQMRAFANRGKKFTYTLKIEIK